MSKRHSNGQRTGVLILIHLLSFATSLAEISLGELNLVARRWGVDQGHIGLESQTIAHTPDGAIWVGTLNGLFQIKGQQITHFHTSQIAPISYRNINRLCVDPKGSLWLTTSNHTIFRHHEGQFTKAPQEEKPDRIICWSPHFEEGIISCHLNKDVYSIYHVTQDKCLLLSEGSEIIPRFIHMHSKDQIWIGMRDGTVASLKDGTLTPLPTSTIKKVGGFLTRRDQSLLAFGSDGTYLLENGEWKKHLQFSQPINSRYPARICTEDHEGRLWLSADRSGLWLCQTDGTLQKIAAGRNSIPGTIGHLLTDFEGNIWADTFSGLYQLRYSPVVTRPVPFGITSPNVISVKTDREGAIWFTCFGGIGRLLPGQDETELVIPRPIVEVTHFAPENSKSVWFGSKNLRFFHWNGTDTTRVPFPQVPKALTTTGFEAGHDGRVWVTGYAGVFCCDPTKKPLAFEKISGTQGLPDTLYLNVRVDHEGTVFLRAREWGIFTLKKNDTRWSPLFNKKFPSFTQGGPIAPDSDGRLWYLSPKLPFDFNAKGSIGLVTSDKHLIVPLKNLGIRTRIASSLALDHHDGLWVQTSIEGLFHLRKSELLQCIHDPSITPSVTHFGLPNGLKSLGATFSNSGLYCGSDGLIWVATKEGLSSISPERWAREKAQASAPQLFLKGIEINNQPVSHSSDLSIPPEAYSVEIQFDSLSFGFPSEIHFKHRLIGSSHHWQESGDRRSVTFQKLPPGDYRFEVKSTDRFGSWSEKSLTLPFTVLPYWWERRSVQFALLAFIGLFCLWLVHLRLRSLRRKSALQENFSRQLISSQEQERKRIAGELHDSLGQSLLVVKNLAVLGERQDATSPGLYPEIAESAAEALEQVRSISRDLRPPELDHLGITKALTATIARVENSTTINFTSHVDEIADLLSPDQEICLYRILQESLNNVLKHADSQQVTILVSKKARSIDLLIEDDGCGFVPGNLEKKGIGLSNMRDRAQLSGGIFSIDSSSGKGTRCHLALPLRVSPTPNT